MPDIFRSMVIARIHSVYYGLPDSKMGCLGGATNLAQLPKSNHKFLSYGGILEAENHTLLNAFFEKKRSEKKSKTESAEEWAKPFDRRSANEHTAYKINTNLL